MMQIDDQEQTPMSHLKETSLEGECVEFSDQNRVYSPEFMLNSK